MKNAEQKWRPYDVDYSKLSTKKMFNISSKTDVTACWDKGRHTHATYISTYISFGTSLQFLIILFSDT